MEVLAMTWMIKMSSEFGKRMDGPGGRRSAPRQPVLLRAALHTLQHSRGATLFDVSATGAQMSMPVPLKVGQEIWLSIPPAEIFGTIVWVKEDTCGIAFDEALDEGTVASFQARGKVMMVHGLSKDEMLGAEDWKDSLAR
jgi:hypothetical protein